MSAVLDTTGVHLGHWVNWSLGTIRGSTITLTRHDGALLTAFLAMFVTFAGSRIWKIAAFIIHLSLAKGSESPQDALFHQRQAILRNASTADEAFWSLSRVGWSWRKSNRFGYVLRKVGPLAIVSLAAGLAFAVAGVFSSQVSSALGNVVLLSGRGCAWVNGSGLSTADDVSILQPYQGELIQDASQRAQQCYASSSGTRMDVSNMSTDNCQTFIKPFLPVSVTRNASCPFDPKICQSNNSNLIIDTGFLDSHSDLGVNAPPEKRVTHRSVMQCAPLVLEGYSSVVDGPTNGNNTITQSETKWVQYHYGTRSFQNTTHNFTYQYPLNIPTNAANKIGTTGFQADYTVLTSISYANNSDSATANFVAIPELTRPDADTILVFLSPNSVIFSSPVDDPMYSAHQGPVELPTIGGDTSGGFVKAWFGDNPTNVLGCTTQIQFCNPNLPLEQGCTPLTSPTLLQLEDLSPIVPPVTFPWRDQTEADRYGDFFETWSWFSFNPTQIINSLNNLALTGRRNFQSGIQGILAPNQWQIDAEFWFSTHLASLQRAFAETANGPSYPGMDQLLWPPLNDIDEDFCKSQTILSTNYTSFSTLGLALTFALGGLIIVISYVLEPALHWIQRRWRWKWHSYAMTEWWLNETLQLQSFVHEELGMGTWTREIGIMPTTKAGEPLATIDLYDPERPRFKAPKLTESFSEEKFGGVSTTENVGGKYGGVEKVEDVGSISQASSSDSSSEDEADTIRLDAPAGGQGAGDPPEHNSKRDGHLEVAAFLSGDD